MRGMDREVKGVCEVNHIEALIYCLNHMGNEPDSDGAAQSRRVYDWDGLRHWVEVFDYKHAGLIRLCTESPHGAFVGCNGPYRTAK